MCIVLYACEIYTVQWNLPITDTVVQGLLSVIWGMSFIRKLLLDHHYYPTRACAAREYAVIVVGTKIARSRHLRV